MATLTGSPPTGTHKCFNTRFTCQDPANYTEVGATLRFAVNTAYLPRDIDCLPSVDEVKFTPAIVSLGEDLGQRASLTVDFKDHKHSDAGAGYDKYYDERTYNPYEQGSHWGKFKARHPFMQGRNIRIIRGLLGDALADMETRNYVIEHTEGPSYEGIFSIIAKDILKLADGDRAQAPALSDGLLSADITLSDDRLTLTPSGVGDDYDPSGYLNIGGKEVAAFTRLDDAVLLMHFGGADASTTFTDSSASAHASTVFGNAQIDTAQSKFGGSSGLFDGTGDYVLLDGSSDFAFGTGDFEVNMHVRLNAVGALATLIDFRSGAGDIALTILKSAANVLQIAVANATKITGTTAMTTGVWYHVTVARVAGSMRAFLDGTQEGSTYASAENLIVGASRPAIGVLQTLTTVFFNGWMDELRVKKGTGVSANFTAPVAAYTSTPTGDTFRLTTRGAFNTEAQAHEADDRAQQALAYSGEDPADIVYDLLLNFASVPAAYMQLADWQAETANFYGSLFTALITEPTSVNELLSEIMDLGFAIWWDDRSQLIRFQVLRQIATTAATYTDDDRIRETLTIKEQPEKRLSQVWTYFAPLNPLVNVDQLDNYRSIAKTTDADAEADYGVPAIRKRFTRWIPEGGGTIAQTSNQTLLSRYRDPPRRFNFDLFRMYSAMQDPVLGGGYQMEAWCLQQDTGERITVPIQITKLNPEADRFEIEAEEMQFDTVDNDPAARVIIIDADTFDVNLRTLHDTLFAPATSGDTVTLIIQNGAIIGASSTAARALDIGSWASGVVITVQIAGRIEGAGGRGGNGGTGAANPATVGLPGGTALYTRYAITIVSSGGQIWSGGGGGGPGPNVGFGTFPGSGGGGSVPGLPGAIGSAGVPGNPGTTELGGAAVGSAGAGGNPGSAGTGGGAAGAAIDGVSFCTINSPAPSILGGQVN